MQISRRRFLDAAALLAAASPLAVRAAIGARRQRPDDAVAMALAVHDGRTSALALIDQAIARLDKINPRINAVAHPNYERARERARSGVSGPLAGVPTLIKDNLEQKGLPFTIGSRLLRNNIGKNDAPYAVAIERAGLISIGRSTLPEFAGNASTEPLLTGPTRNPWSLSHSAGGSSGGSAAAVAAGVVPVAHGNDYAGSIRHAAAPCGLVGLKPSRGRMAGDEHAVRPTDFLVQGCVSRTVRDTAAWLAATEAVGPDAPHSPVGVVAHALARKVRIGVHADLTRTGGQPDRDVRRVFDKAVALLARLGHHVAARPLAFDGARATAAFSDFFEGRAARGIVAAFQAPLGRSLTLDDVEPATLGMVSSGLKVSDARMAESVAILSEAAARYVAQFDDIDIYMTPVFSSAPVPIGRLGPAQAWPERRAALVDYGSYCWVDNVAGTPAISLPLGFSGSGVPVGIQFAARPGNERLLLELAFQIENTLRWPELRPPVWAA